MASSFKKKASSKPAHPRGSRPSLYNAQLLVSSGVPSMDSLLGGGLAVGTVLLVEEDVYNSYSRLLFKYFLSEGVMSGHSIYLASAERKDEDIMMDLPAATNDELLSQKGRSVATETIEEEDEQDDSSKTEEVSMKIAWRYQNMPKAQTSFSNQFGHSYDLTVKMPPSRLQSIEKTCFNPLDSPVSSARDLYVALKEDIANRIQSGHFSVDHPPSTKQRNILRIGLQSLGSPLWLDQDGIIHDSSTGHSSLLQFLHCLRGLLRKAYAVAMVTVPTHLMQDSAYVKRLQRMCDAAVRVESFAGSEKETNPVFKDYHGLFHINKLPCLNSLVTYHPETLDLAFKLKRKKFSIEKLHLPPELSETTSRSQEQTIKISKSSIVGEKKEVKKRLTPKDIDF